MGRSWLPSWCAGTTCAARGATHWRAWTKSVASVFAKSLSHEPTGPTMSRHALGVISMVVLSGLSAAALTGGASATVPDPASAAAQAGLVSVKSRVLDVVYLRSGPNGSGYRKVIIEPAQVTFRTNWLKDLNATRGPSRWVSASDAEEVRKLAVASMTKAVTDEFVAKGFEVVTEPGPGVLRVAPSVTELDVYEPDVPFARPEILFTKDAGTATLILEARDAEAGALVGVVVDRATATQISRINRTTQTSNLFWFDAMFRLWTDSCIAELQAGPVR